MRSVPSKKPSDKPKESALQVMPVLRIFARHLRKYWLWVVVIVLTSLVTDIFQTTITPYIAKLLFDALASGQEGARSITRVLPYFQLFVGSAVLVYLCARVMNLLTVRLQPRVMADLEHTGVSYLLGHSHQFFQDNFSGSLVRRVNRLSHAFEEIMDVTQQKLLPVLIAFVGILIVIFRQNVVIGSIVAAWVAIMVTYNYLYSRWKVKYDVMRAEQDSKCVGLLSDIISNVISVKLFAGSKREVTGFDRETSRLREFRLKSWTVHDWSYAVQAAIFLVLQAVVLWVALGAWSEGRLSAGDIVLFQSYFAILFTRTHDFSRLVRQLYRAFADATEMVDMLNTPYQVQDDPRAKALRVKQAEVTFKDVAFTYLAGRSVLNKFDLTIQPGEKIALVGSSGAGKSTVVKLLFRFYDVTRGVITIDGQDIAHVTQDSLRQQIALVPQEPLLFHRSLIDNIRYGKPSATEKEVIRAAKLAHCHEFIERLPQKYDTHVGERGVKLSGGERQRVAIARAILKDAPILVLDEATSSLDSESEGMIQDALHTLMKDKTTIVIAHRLSTIMSMDRIVIMDGGRVVDVGTHDELVNQKGIYQKLWNLQVGGFFSYS